jgi:mono/diheme cytochrome c family protein
MGRIAVVALVLALGIGVAACGGDDDSGTATTTTEETTTTTTTNGETVASGEEIFVDNCGTCHMLSAAGPSGTVGPSLDGLGLDASAVETQVREGGGGMPAFEGQLSAEEIEAVSAYVAESS